MPSAVALVAAEKQGALEGGAAEAVALVAVEEQGALEGGAGEAGTASRTGSWDGQITSTLIGQQCKRTGCTLAPARQPVTRGLLKWDASLTTERREDRTQKHAAASLSTREGTP